MACGNKKILSKNQQINYLKYAILLTHFYSYHATTRVVVIHTLNHINNYYS